VSAIIALCRPSSSLPWRGYRVKGRRGMAHWPALVGVGAARVCQRLWEPGKPPDHRATEGPKNDFETNPGCPCPLFEPYWDQMLAARSPPRGGQVAPHCDSGMDSIIIHPSRRAIVGKLGQTPIERPVHSWYTGDCGTKEMASSANTWAGRRAEGARRPCDAGRGPRCWAGLCQGGPCVDR
jgi:hypothetical protein